MAQDKAAVKSDADQPRDGDGRFTEKDDATKSAGGSGGGTKTKDDRAKSSAGSTNGSKGSASKSARSGTGGQGSKSR